MKKSLLALAVLGAFAGAASAQSSVTLYGRVDLSVGKAAGSSAKFMSNGSGSRLGVRGVEDLGGGLQALFNIEHRYEADTGIVGSGSSGGSTPQPRFWHGRSIVGLQGGFGQVVFGREYSTAFLQSQLVADPWGWDTVVCGAATCGITGGGLVTVRNDSSITYRISAAGFSFGAQIAEANDTFTSQPNRPWNFAVSYAGGPFVVGLGHERNGAEAAGTQQWTTLNGSYNFGFMKLGAFYGTGNNAADVDTDSWLVSGTFPIGPGELRAAYGQREVGNVKNIQALAVGYHHSLSKRTTVYFDAVNNKKLTTSKTGYDVGVKHNF